MRQATHLGTLWQALLRPFASAFTRLGFRRFVEWVTALALNVEEHTRTQSVVAIERIADWKAWESFAASGVCEGQGVTHSLTRLIEDAPGRLWHGSHVSAVDDTKVHRSGKHVGGTGTFPEDTARCPNRATTVRAHNGVALGAILHNPGQPAWFRPIAGRLYFRKAQWPERPKAPGCTEPFRTTCERTVAPLREQARITGGRHLGVFDGGYALKSVPSR